MTSLDVERTALAVLAAVRLPNCTPLEVLLLPKTASLQDARAAYKRLLILHPDKNPGAECACEAFKYITSAWDQLRSSEGRVFSDATNHEGPRRWSAFTDARNIPANSGFGAQSSPAHPPPAPGRQSGDSQEHAAPSAAASKWGRPATEAHRLLKVVPAAPTANAPPSRLSFPPSSCGRGAHKDSTDAPNDLPQAIVKQSNDHEISESDFYGKNESKKQRPGDAAETRTAPAAPAALGGGKRSKWAASATLAATSDLLRAPLPADSVPNSKMRDRNGRDAAEGRLLESQMRRRKRKVIVDESGELHLTSTADTVAVT